MPTPATLSAFGAGVLVANSVPHAYAALTGSQHMTPLRGRGSSPAVNAVWSAMNLAASAALTRLSSGSVARAVASPDAAGAARRGFKVGVVAFSAWALAAEWVTDFH